MSSSSVLPLRLQQLYDALAGRGDVAWETLAEAIEANLENTPAPQWIGPYVTRLNRRLRSRGLAVRPGVTKGTMRLIVI